MTTTHRAALLWCALNGITCHRWRVPGVNGAVGWNLHGRRAPLRGERIPLAAVARELVDAVAQVRRLVD